MAVCAKQFRANFGVNVSFLETWRESTNFTWNDVGRLVGRCPNFRLLVMVVQICVKHMEVIWGPWCISNDPCKFCSVKHDTSVVTVQSRIFCVGQWAITTLKNVDNGSICCSMKFLWRVGINFRFETSCFLSHAKDAPIGWWVESIKRTAWDAPYQGLPGRNRDRKVCIVSLYQWMPVF